MSYDGGGGGGDADDDDDDAIEFTYLYDEWYQCVDKQSKEVWYQNRVTDESVWEV